MGDASPIQEAPTHEFAQTILQLLIQMHRSGYEDIERVLIRDAYDTAIGLFSASFRSNRKPFLCHLVGTASILVYLRQRSEVLAAGLLHAAYSLGDFGHGPVPDPDWRRGRLRTAVGSEVEHLVHAYSEFEWDPWAVADAVADGRLKEDRRDIVVIRLANKLEDLLDLGLMYSNKPDSDSEASAELARDLGMTELAEQIDLWRTAGQGLAPPQALVGGRQASFVAPSSSYELCWLQAPGRGTGIEV
jgi:(p)ppGpp synthase/HD superfamily hydrolase